MRAALMVFVIVSAPLSGCMSGEGGSLSEEDLDVGPDELVSGHFQSVSLESRQDMSVYVPYLVRDPITGFIQNSTVFDIERGDSFSLDLLSPPLSQTLLDPRASSQAPPARGTFERAFGCVKRPIAARAGAPNRSPL